MESFTARNRKAVKPTFLPGSSHFLSAGDMGGEINSLILKIQDKCCKIFSFQFSKSVLFMKLSQISKIGQGKHRIFPFI